MKWRPDYDNLPTEDTITQTVNQTDGDRPGDIYNNDPKSIDRTLRLLHQAGWKTVRQRRDGVYLLQRPGTPDKEHNATLGAPESGGGLHCFTGNDPTFGEGHHSHFEIYTRLQHGGDYSKAARELADTPDAPNITLHNPDLVITVQDKEVRPAIPSTTGFPVDTWRASDLLPLADEPIDWLVKRIVADGTYGLVGGQQKSLKTEIMIALDLAVLTGTPFLGDDRFPVAEPSPVLLYLSEGGKKPYMRRLARWARALDIDLPNRLDDYAIGFAGARMDEPFLKQLQTRIDTTGARLVRLDALYGFSGGDVEGGSIFAMGDLLTGFSNICEATGVAGYITHHFNETGRGSELTRFSMAGSAGWVDSWIMILHRKPPNPDLGQFSLGLRIGSRQWGENAWELDVDLGQFDADLGTHKGLPKTAISEADWTGVAKWGRSSSPGSSDNEETVDQVVYRIIRDEPWLTKTAIAERTGRNKQQALAVIANGIQTGTLIVGHRPIEEGSRTVRRQVIGSHDSYRPKDVEIGDET